MKNWKTSLSGLVSSLALLVALVPDRFGGEDSVFVLICMFIAAGGLASLGINAEDASKLASRLKNLRNYR